MIYYYMFETEHSGDVDYEFEPTIDDLRIAIKDILMKQSPTELYCTITELAESEWDVEEYFREELQDYFEEMAHEQFERTVERQIDLEYDYYRNKL